MTSKIIVNNIESDVGISSVTFNDTISGNLEGNINSSGTSTFNVISGVSTIGVTTVHLTGINDLSYPTVGPLSNRNLVQNGAMTVSQRSTSESSLTSGNNYILDRWRTYIQNIGTYTISQASDAPDGFKYSYKILCTAGDASPAAADDMSFYCPYEGQDLQQLKKGTASAQSVTLSFWVKSNKTSTGQVNIRDQDNNRMISGTYTINSAGTWEYKTITFPGDTTGVLDSDNAASISIQWYLDSGSNFSSGSMNSTWGTDSIDKRNVNNFGLASSTDNYWQITGIQLESGSVATPFEHRSYGDELARCQRYYQKPRVIFYGHVPSVNSSATVNCPMFAEMRADPTASLVTAHTTDNISTTYPPATVGVLKNGWVVRVVVDSVNVAWYSATWQLSAEL